MSKCLIHWKNSAHLLYLLILHELLSIANIIATQNTPIRVGIANSKLTEKFLKKVSTLNWEIPVIIEESLRTRYANPSLSYMSYRVFEMVSVYYQPQVIHSWAQDFQ